nr:MAG TPA: hypothetical protein [Bacteriophage sp.]
MELRWSSLDNTLKELDASGSFLSQELATLTWFGSLYQSLKLLFGNSYLL